jgi:hypothetical protein
VTAQAVRVTAPGMRCDHGEGGRVEAAIGTVAWVLPATSKRFYCWPAVLSLGVTRWRVCRTFASLQVCACSQRAC